MKRRLPSLAMREEKKLQSARTKEASWPRKSRYKALKVAWFLHQLFTELQIMAKMISEDYISKYVGVEYILWVMQMQLPFFLQETTVFFVKLRLRGLVARTGELLFLFAQLVDNVRKIYIF